MKNHFLAWSKLSIIERHNRWGYKVRLHNRWRRCCSFVTFNGTRCWAAHIKI